MPFNFKSCFLFIYFIVVVQVQLSPFSPTTPKRCLLSVITLKSPRVTYSYDGGSHLCEVFYILFNFILKILFTLGERRREGEREREISIGCLSHASYQGPGLQLRHMPPLGIEPATFYFSSRTGTQATEPQEPGQVFHILN